MEGTTVKNPIMLYTEQTPNPESLKFVTNKMLYRGTADFREEALAQEWSPLGTELFKLAKDLQRRWLRSKKRQGSLKSTQKKM